MKRTVRATLSLVAMVVGQFLSDRSLVEAQVVQLPSTRSLSYTGSVWVPDGGSTSLGGRQSSSYGNRRSGWGPSSNHASSSNLGASTLTASVQIIDLAALDEAILASAESPSAKADGVASAKSGESALDLVVSSTTLSEEPSNAIKQHATYLGENTSTRVGADPGKWQRVLSGGSNRPTRNPTLLESDIRYYLKRGELAEDAGSLMAARVYYKMARDLMTPELIERYQTIVSERKAAEEAQLKAELEAARRKF